MKNNILTTNCKAKLLLGNLQNILESHATPNTCEDFRKLYLSNAIKSSWMKVRFCLPESRPNYRWPFSTVHGDHPSVQCLPGRQKKQNNLCSDRYGRRWSQKVLYLHSACSVAVACPYLPHLFLPSLTNRRSPISFPEGMFFSSLTVWECHQLTCDGGRLPRIVALMMCPTHLHLTIKPHFLWVQWKPVNFHTFIWNINLIKVRTE